MIRTLIAVAGSLLPLVAYADAQLQMVDPANKVDSTYLIKGSKVRVEAADSNGIAMIYDAATHGMLILDSGKRRYMRMDVETATKAAAAATSAMSEVEKQLAALPPEQREMMKQYLPKLPAAGTVPVVAAARTGKSDSVGGVACDLVSVTMDGKAVGEACVASKVRDLSDADHQTLRTMFEDMGKMAGSIAGGDGRAAAQFAALGGVPLRWRDADTGRVTETRIDAKAAVDAAGFEIPAGYTETTIEIPSL